MKHTITIILPVVVLLLAVLGCSQSLYMQGRRHLEEGQPQRAAEMFRQEVAADATNYRAWRELGIAQYHLDKLDDAEEYLVRADSIRPDARSRLYLGMVKEKQEDFRAAIFAYSSALAANPSGKLSELIRSRRSALVGQQIAAEAKRSVENEMAIDVDTIPEGTIAVVDFDGSNLPAELAPLAKGLSDFTASDLAKVTQLTVVERRRLDALLDELRLGTSGYVDPASAPRVGKLMGSQRLVTGSVLGDGEESLTLEGVVVSTRDGSLQPSAPVEDKLERVFQMQKRFVFSLVNDLGIKLTADERNEISEFPTESYLAFLAYSRGLDYSSRNMPQAAEQEFARAIRLDPGFGAARDHLTSTRSNLAGGGGSLTQFEGEIDTESKRQGGGGLEGSLEALVVTNGGISAPSGGSSEPTVAPPTSEGTGTLIVRGNISDAD